MNNKQFLKKAFAAILVTVMVCSASVLFAQVKIGSNPTLINAANNLEVEASGGNKVSVDKTTGKVTIADGSQGSAKILTSDANGVATWLTPSVQDSPVLFSVSNSVNQPVYAGVTVKADFAVANYDKNSTFDLANDNFTVPSGGTGVYQLSTMYATTNQAILQGVYVAVYVNGVIKRYISVGNSGPGAGLTGAGTIIMQLNAGEVVDMRWIPSLSAGQGEQFFIYNLSVAFLSK